MGIGTATGCHVIAGRESAVDLTTAESGEDCCWSEGEQHGFTAQQLAHVTAGHLPGIWHAAGIASSGCEAVAAMSNNVISALFTTA
jgi:hypothetical protein